MIPLRRCRKHSVIILVVMTGFLGLSLWSLVSTVRVSVYCSCPPEMRSSCTSQSEQPVNVAVLPASRNDTITTSRKPTTSAKRSRSRKPRIDMVNDYHPFVDFKFVFPQISPKVQRTQNIFIIILINSGAIGEKYRRLREAIRQTWGNQGNCEQRKASRNVKLKDLRWLLVFVVGKAGPGTDDDELNMAEAKQHNDMLIGNITDNYLNNVIKLYMGLVWASRFDIKYILKTDDDVYVRVPRVVEYLVRFRLPSPFYGGWVVNSQRVNRRADRKWGVSWKYYGELKFPRFNTGAYFILSSDLLNRLFNYVYIRKPFHLDDAYVGVAMRDFGIKEKKIRSFFLMHDINPFVHEAEDCKLLSIDAFSHSMQPESMRLLHNRVSSLACGNTKIQPC